MNKIFLLCDGGLGNQLFEYAFGRTLALRSGGELVLDPWEVTSGRSRPLELHRFNIKARLVNRVEHILCRLVDSQRLSSASRLIRKIAPGLLPKVVRKKKHGFDPRLLEQEGSLFLDGWWQSELYFRDHRQAILSELSFRTPPSAENQKWLERIAACNAVCVHVRRGDYVSDPFALKNFGLCGLDYYKAAIALIQQRVPDPTYFIFSDDPEWTRQNLPVPEPRHFITHNCNIADYEDLRLMSACSHFVIANSTFSWWGAWLSTHPGKIVVAPQRWFVNESVSSQDIIPESWIKI
jgi:hypothetical protein